MTLRAIVLVSLLPIFLVACGYDSTNCGTPDRYRRCPAKVVLGGGAGTAGSAASNAPPIDLRQGGAPPPPPPSKPHHGHPANTAPGSCPSCLRCDPPPATRGEAAGRH